MAGSAEDSSLYLYFCIFFSLFCAQNISPTQNVGICVLMCLVWVSVYYWGLSMTNISQGDHLQEDWIWVVLNGCPQVRFSLKSDETSLCSHFPGRVTMSSILVSRFLPLDFVVIMVEKLLLFLLRGLRDMKVPCSSWFHWTPVWCFTVYCGVCG